MPDIDIDFCMNRRGEVINYVTEKYGRGNVAQIITFGTMAAKAAIKDVGRAMDVPYSDVDRIAKIVPTMMNIKIENAVRESPALQQAYKSDTQVRQLTDSAKKAEALVRYAGVHAPRVVISPGPIEGGMIDYFIDRKHGRKKIEYELPELEEILRETFGVIVYQEHVMQIANRLAGYSMGEADVLRRAMGKKKPEEMAQQRERFIQGAVQRGYPPKKIEKIFDLMAQFAGYGFNKSHSAAYALLAYHTAYLKTHYPVEFMAALLTSVTGSTDDVVKYINECREMGISVEAPDINVSDANFTPHGEAIRFGLAAVKNVGGNAIESIVAARKKLGHFKFIFEFCENVDLRLLNKRVLESLIKSGAMDSLGRRGQLMAVLEKAIEGAQKTQRDAESGQHGLFGVFQEEEVHNHNDRLPETPDWDEHQRLAAEKEILGFFITGHPLEKYREKLEDLRALNTEEISAMKSSTGKDENITP